ncbi:MAG: energy transducer TonB [Betaproteobacteria bacterium]|nr:energy transducer TonB [Betaproteobacteria bacterium]
MDMRSSQHKSVGVLLVMALHAAALWGLWTHRLIALPEDATTLFVNFIVPPPPRVEPPPRREPPRSRPEARPQPSRLVAEAPLNSPAEFAVPPAPTPVVAAAVEPKPAGPVTLGAELSVSCPERTAPNYPVPSRRMGETGTAVLRVELDEQGRVAAARVATGSGFDRLDAAALAAVKTWRCNPAQRDGQPVRAVALQPFKFVLQGS